MSAAHATVDLDDTEGLLDADRDGLLRAAAMAGRRCGRPRPPSTRARWTSLADGQRPRTVIWVAGRGPAETAGAMLAAALGGVPPANRWCSRPQAPPWIGPLDVLVVAGDDPGDPVLVLGGRDGGAPRRAGRRRRSLRRPAARCHRRAGRRAGAPAVGARRVRSVPLPGRRSGHAGGGRIPAHGERRTWGRWPTNSTPRRCATAPAARCSPTRPRCWPSGCRAARRCWPATAPATLALARHGAAVLLRVAGVRWPRSGLADALVAAAHAARCRRGGRRHR